MSTSVSLQVIAQQEPTAQEEEKKDEEAGDEKPPVAKPSTPRSEINIAPPTEFSAQQKGDIKHYLTEQAIQPILVGPDDYLTLVDSNVTENPKGVMILLPDWQQNATNPKALNHLRALFPQHGWTTVTIQPPGTPDNYPSIALEQEARTKENQETLAQYQQKLAQILTAVTTQAKEYPGIILVVAQGQHAALLLSIYQQKLSELPSALVLLSAYLSDNKHNELSAQHLSTLELPVLDLTLRTDRRLIKQSAKLRKKWVNQELKSLFRQQEIFNNQSGYYPKNSLVQAIRGWLTALGW